jgi:hypothetical protein
VVVVVVVEEVVVVVVVEVVVEVVDQPEAKVAVVLVLFRVMAAITEH